jgi:hypothetical protein
MPFSNDDYREIRRFLSELLQQTRLGFIHEEAEAHAREADAEYEGQQEGNAHQRLKRSTIDYFSHVVQALRSRSRSTYRTAFNVSREFVRTESGEQLSGFTLVATADDREVLGFDTISLDTAPNMDGLIECLTGVIRSIEEEEE